MEIRRRKKCKQLKSPGMVGRISPARSAIMAKVRLRDTKPEIQLRKALWSLGLRYRICKNGLPGRPDVTFGPAKVAVFVDGDFWHGRNFSARLRRGQFKVRRKFWIHKIRSNMARDLRNNRDLSRLGFRVIWIWASDLKLHEDRYARRLAKIVNARRGRFEAF